jgi:hypothetical protein
MKRNAPKIPDQKDFLKAFKAMLVLRDFYKHNYHNGKDVDPKSFFGKRAKIMEDAISLIPSSIRNPESPKVSWYFQ